jgi:hypothetical protein
MLNLKQKQNKNNTTAQDRILHRNQGKDRSSKEKIKTTQERLDSPGQGSWLETCFE